MKKFSLAKKTAMSAALMTLAVNAWSVTFTTGDAFTMTADAAQGGGTTTELGSFGTSDFPVESVYTNDGTISAGTESTDLIGKTLSYEDDGINALDGLSYADGSGAVLNPDDKAGFGSDWFIQLSYHLEGDATFLDGALDASPNGTMSTAFDTQEGGGAACTGQDGQCLIDDNDVLAPTWATGGESFFEIFYDEDFGFGSPVQVGKFYLDSVELAVGSTNFYASASYDFCEPTCTDFQKDFFTHVPTGDSYYDLGGTVVFRADVNLDPQYLPECTDQDCETLTRNLDVNPSIRFKAYVPAPAGVALFGLGLIVLAGVQRRKA